MPLFRKPQQQKKSAKQEQAQAGKKALAQEQKGFLSSFFGRGKEEQKAPQPQKETTVEEEKGPEAPPKERFGSASEVIIRPRVTEKSTDAASDSNAYVFDVAAGASKQQIAAGVAELYGVSVTKVNTVPVLRKRIRGRRGERGVKGGGKKAYVFLKKGDSIEFV